MMRLRVVVLALAHWWCAGFVLCPAPATRTALRAEELDEYRKSVAQSSLTMLQGLVAGEGELEAKLAEMAELLDANGAASPVVEETAPVVVEETPAPVVVAEEAPVVEEAPAVAEEAAVDLKTMALRAVKQEHGPALAKPVEKPPLSPLKENVLKAVKQFDEGRPPADDYVAYKSPDLDYTLWVNPKNPKDSYYEYHTKSE